MFMTAPSMRARQRGLSLVELMVGIAVGMFIVAAAATLVTTQLTENRRLLLEVQVQQDLRATVDIMTRELRRSGSLPFLGDSTSYVWTSGQSWAVNPYMAVTPASAPANSVGFESNRSEGGSGPYGFRLVNGTIESRLGPAGWQPLTDRATMEVTHFLVTPQIQPSIVVSCNKLCSDGTKSCWPNITVRSYLIDVTGRSASDSAVVRSVSSTVRLKNDVVLSDPALGTSACPV